MNQIDGRTHHYNAEATVIEGHLELPLQQEIGRQAHANLAPQGGYISRRVENYRLGEVISIRSGYTQVAGNRSDKPGEGWSTLTTVVVEGLNVLEVLTADRVVGQIVTDHPPQGYVPTISFLGTRFENLRIAGHPVKLDLDLGILGPKPANDEPFGPDADLKRRIAGQYNRIRESKSLPADMLERYNRLSSSLGSPEEVECSLVNQASGDYPGPSFGHLIHIPDFGWISLGKLRVTYKEVKAKGETHRKTTVHLTMVDLHLGCATSGTGSAGSLSTNGQTVP
ncbi:MAG: hypothetical protein P4L26_00825 [Terracidiphilus sp.]|nr:hypothetical protein [Terracidiphilus sp.]